jgi:hypothetical protein
MPSRATPQRIPPKVTATWRFVKSASSPLVTPVKIRHSARNVPDVTNVTPSARGDGMGAATRRRAAVAVALALIAVAGCTDGSPNSQRPPSSHTSSSPPTVSSSAPDPRASAMAEALAAYRGFWQAATEAEARPGRRHPQLARYATDKALAAEQATIVLYRQQGIVGRGEPKLSPEVVSISLAPGQALIRDCLDLTDVDAVYRNTGKSAIASGQSRRHIATAKAAIYNGRWVVTELIADRTRSC